MLLAQQVQQVPQDQREQMGQMEPQDLQDRQVLRVRLGQTEATVLLAPQVLLALLLALVHQQPLLVLLVLQQADLIHLKYSHSQSPPVLLVLRDRPDRLVVMDQLVHPDLLVRMGLLDLRVQPALLVQSVLLDLLEVQAPKV